MSFGFSVSDVLICIQLAHKVWRDCRDAPEEFKAVSVEVQHLELFLNDSKDKLNDLGLDQRQTADLKCLIEGCNDVLKELESLLQRYQSLGTKNKRTRDRLRWKKEPIKQLQQRITSTTALLTSFNVSLASSGVARVEKLLQGLSHHLRLREGSPISVDNIESAEEGDENVWHQIAQELQDVGITPDDIREYRSYITDWIKNALQTGERNEASIHADIDVQNCMVASATAEEQPGVRAMQGIEIGIKDEDIEYDHREDEHSEDANVKDERIEDEDAARSEDNVEELGEEIIQNIPQAKDRSATPPPPPPPSRPTSSTTRYCTEYRSNQKFPRPSDVSLSESQLKQYFCMKCRWTPLFSTWFELLVHVRMEHPSGWPSPNSSNTLEAGFIPSVPPGDVQIESGNIISITSPETFQSVDYDSQIELYHMLTVLSEAVQKGIITAEIPQLMYDLYFSRKCLYAECHARSETPEENRKHLLQHFLPYPRRAGDLFIPVGEEPDPTTLVTKSYICSRLAFPMAGILFPDLPSFKKHSASTHPLQPLQHDTIFSGRRVEDIAAHQGLEWETGDQWRSRELERLLHEHLVPQVHAPAARGLPILPGLDAKDVTVFHARVATPRPFCHRYRNEDR